MTLDSDRWNSPVAIAHRGSRSLWPENTLLAFDGAYQMGYRHLETDLRVTSDGVLVCFHDPTLDRTTNGVGLVSDHSLADVRSLDAGHRHSTGEGFEFRDSGVQVPTLEEVIESFPDASLVVDMKDDGVVEPLAAFVDDHQIHERLIVGAFSDARIQHFREITDGRVATSSGPTLSRMWVLASRVGRGASGAASALQLPTHLRGVRVIDQKLVDAAHASGLQVHVWTVNTRAEMVELLDIGVDGLVTDRPDVLKEVLDSRGEWAQ